MKKQNQAAHDRKSAAKIAQQKSSNSVSGDIMISRRRADVLAQLAAELNTDPKEIGENAIESYLLFIEKFPHLAEAQPRFVRPEALFAMSPSGPLYDRLDRACAVYDLDRDSLADSAIGAYLDLVLRDTDNPQIRDFTLSCRGSSDPENIEFVLSQLSNDARTLFDNIVGEISGKPFSDACNALSALRQLTMHHPALKNEREALEMIVQGAARLS